MPANTPKSRPPVVKEHAQPEFSSPEAPPTCSWRGDCSSLLESAGTQAAGSQPSGWSECPQPLAGTPAAAAPAECQAAPEASSGSQPAGSAYVEIGAGSAEGVSGSVLRLPFAEGRARNRAIRTATASAGTTRPVSRTAKTSTEAPGEVANPNTARASAANRPNAETTRADPARDRARAVRPK